MNLSITHTQTGNLLSISTLPDDYLMSTLLPDK